MFKRAVITRHFNFNRLAGNPLQWFGWSKDKGEGVAGFGDYLFKCQSHIGIVRYFVPGGGGPPGTRPY
jgi:hypothetical protein